MGGVARAAHGRVTSVHHLDLRKQASPRVAVRTGIRPDAAQAPLEGDYSRVCTMVPIGTWG